MATTRQRRGAQGVAAIPAPQPPAATNADPEALSKWQQVMLPLALSPVVSWLMSWFDPDVAAQAATAAGQDGIDGGGGGSSNSSGTSNHTVFLLVVQIVLQVGLTVLSFYLFWETLRRDFVPRFLMPSTTPNAQLKAMRVRQEGEVEARINDEGGPESGRYRRIALGIFDPELGREAQLECGVWENPQWKNTPAGSVAAAGGDSGGGSGSGSSAAACPPPQAGSGVGRKWILYLNANGVAYQDVLVFTIKYATALRASVLNVNYRGVHGSTGYTTGSRSLMADAERALKYLREELNVPAHDILVHGHSMGGAVAMVLAGRYADERLKCVADRTFARLPLVIAGLLNGMQGLIFGVIFTVAFFWIPVVAFVLSVPALPEPALPYFIRGLWVIGVGVQSVVLLSSRLIPISVQRTGGVCSRLSSTACVFLVPTFIIFALQWAPVVGMRLSAAVEYLFLCDVCGGLLGYMGLLRWPLSRLAVLMDWGIDPERAFDDAFVLGRMGGADPANVLVVAHPQDGIVPYPASLYVGLGLDESRQGNSNSGGGNAGGNVATGDRGGRHRSDSGGGVKSLLLRDTHPNCHMMHLDHRDETWFVFLELCSRLLYR